MNSNNSHDSSADNNQNDKLTRKTGNYWVRVEEDWYIAQYYNHENLFYFPGYAEGVDPGQLHELDECALYKKFEGYKKKLYGIENKTKTDRREGYYWVMHDATWFTAYYLPSNDEFFFPGQYIGFDSSDLEEIDEQRIERKPIGI